MKASDDACRGVVSPDGSFRVWKHREYERFGVLETVRVFTLPDQTMVLDVTNWGTSPEPLRFPAPGRLLVSLADRVSQWRPVLVDVPSRTFRFAPDGEAEPLDRLAHRLATTGERPAKSPVAESKPQALRSRLGAWAMGFGSLLFVAVGVWMAIAGQTTRDRWLGGLCAVFFGACAAVPLLDRRGIRKRRPEHVK